MKKKIIVISCLIVFIVLTFFSAILSVNLTGVLNPISAIYNISKVILDEDVMYVIAQKKPWKIMFAKSYVDEKAAQNILDEYMKNDGYEIYDRMGNIITYKNENGNERRIHFSVNKYYSIWEWI